MIETNPTMPDPMRKTANASDDHRRVSRSVLKLATLIRRSASAVYRQEFGLQGNEWRALALIGDDGPLGHQALSELMTLDKGQVSRVVTSLVDAGLVRRRVEGRNAVLSLAPAGRKLYDRLTRISFRRNERILAGLTDRDVDTLFRCLDTMTRNVVAMQQQDEDAETPSLTATQSPPPAGARPRRAGTARR